MEPCCQDRRNRESVSVDTAAGLVVERCLVCQRRHRKIRAETGRLGLTLAEPGPPGPTLAEAQ